MKSYISHSELSAFYSDRMEWHQRYIEGIWEPPNRAMKVGSLGHRWLEDNRVPLVKRLKEFDYDSKMIFNAKKALEKANKKAYPKKEKTLTAELKSGIKLLAIYDEHDPDTHAIGDHKITESKKDQYFTQWKLDDPETRYSYYDQITFYALVYRIAFHRFPSSIRVNKIYLSKGNCKTLYTARGPADVKYILGKIKHFKSWCEEKDLWDKRLSRKERDILKEGKKQDTLVD